MHAANDLIDQRRMKGADDMLNSSFDANTKRTKQGTHFHSTKTLFPCSFVQVKARNITPRKISLVKWGVLVSQRPIQVAFGIIVWWYEGF